MTGSSSKGGFSNRFYGPENAGDAGSHHRGSKRSSSRRNRCPFGIDARAEWTDVYRTILGSDTSGLPAGTVQLMVGDGTTMTGMELKRSPSGIPMDLTTVIRELNKLRRNDRLYVRIFSNQPGVVIRGEEMPSLPPSMSGCWTPIVLPVEMSHPWEVRRLPNMNFRNRNTSFRDSSR